MSERAVAKHIIIDLPNGSFYVDGHRIPLNCFTGNMEFSHSEDGIPTITMELIAEQMYFRNHNGDVATAHWPMRARTE